MIIFIDIIFSIFYDFFHYFANYSVIANANDSTDIRWRDKKTLTNFKKNLL